MSVAAGAKVVRNSFICLFLFIFSGCTQFGYYAQSVRGQIDIWSRERPIQDVIDDAATPQALREKLTLVLRAREFASAELGLPQNQSYRRYADLRRPYVVWNVFATPEFSTQPVGWCFLIAGCVAYRGYFEKSDADEFAAEAAAQGHDVHVGGVPAYSTLGWFADPMLNTVINYPASEVARIIFHELSHQVVYVTDDSVFNESFAVTVERAGVRRWLAAHGSPEDQQAFERRQRFRTDFIALVQASRARLDALYREPLEAVEMRAQKRVAFEELQRDYRALKASWGGFAGYDRWFAQTPNNALLVTVSIYTGHVAAFEAMLREQGGDLRKFYEAVKALARLDRSAREAVLRKYSPALKASDTL
jgi:predicted aminopeptidase